MICVQWLQSCGAEAAVVWRWRTEGLSLTLQTLEAESTESEPEIGL